MRPRQGPTLRAQWLGQQLRELRESTGRTLKDAAEYLQRDPSTVSRFESADYPIRRPDLMALLDLYGVSDGRRRDGLLRLREDVWQSGWWEQHADAFYDPRFMDYVWLEGRASEIRSFDAFVVPGLLQTREYAEATIRAQDLDASTEDRERWLELRMERQRALMRDDGPQLSVVLDEAVLHRFAGSPAVMRAQLSHLTEVTEQPAVDVRVLPFRTPETTIPYSTFKVFVMGDPYPDVGYAETLGGAVYVEGDNAERFSRVYARLRAAVLEPDKSAEVIRAAAKRWR